jgi:hypothetical protein
MPFVLSPSTMLRTGYAEQFPDVWLARRIAISRAGGSRKVTEMNETGGWRRTIALMSIGAMSCIDIAVCDAADAGAKRAAGDYPSRPIRFIEAFGAGGTTDVLSRSLGIKLTERFGQQIVVDNRPGAGGNIGAEMAAKATPDGYTLFMGWFRYSQPPRACTRDSAMTPSRTSTASR